MLTQRRPHAGALQAAQLPHTACSLMTPGAETAAGALVCGRRCTGQGQGLLLALCSPGQQPADPHASAAAMQQQQQPAAATEPGRAQQQRPPPLPAGPQQLLAQAAQQAASQQAARFADSGARAQWLLPRSSSLAIYVDALCAHEYMCTCEQLPDELRPRLLQLAVSDMAAVIWG